MLSFGHMGFAAISGYAFALLATTVERKARIVPDVPLGLDDVSLNPLVAAAAAVVITVVAGLVVGLGLARSGAKSGAVAATVITLALLFMVHEVGGAYADLTGGRNGISFSVGRGLDGRLWVYLALIASRRRRSPLQEQPHRSHGPGGPRGRPGQPGPWASTPPEGRWRR